MHGNYPTQKHAPASKTYQNFPYYCTNNINFNIGYQHDSTNFSIFNMKKREIKRPQHVEGKGLIKQIEYLRLLHNVSKSEFVKGTCSVAMYNRYLQGANISLDALEKLVGYFDYKVTITLDQ